MGLSRCLSYTRFLSSCFPALPPLAIKLRLRYGLTCPLFKVLLRRVSAERCDICYLCISFSSTEPFERCGIAVSVGLLLQQSWASRETYCVTLSPSGGVTLTGFLTSLYSIVSQQKGMLPTCTSEVL